MALPRDDVAPRPTSKPAKAPAKGNSSAPRGDVAAAKAREIQAQQDAARQRALEEAYPTGGLVELRPGDLVFQAGLVGAVVAGRIFSVGDTNFQMTTVLGTEAEVL